MCHALLISWLIAAQLVAMPYAYARDAGAAAVDTASNRHDAELYRPIESFLNVHHEALFEQRDPRLRAEFEALQWTFIRRPQPNRPELTARAYGNLFDLVKTDSTADQQSLLEVAGGLAKYGVHHPTRAFAEAPLLLAERTGLYERAASLVRQGLDSVSVQMERDRQWFDDEEAFQAMVDQRISVLTDALGWIHHLAGRPDSAEATLLRAHSLWAGNGDNLYHLGRFYEARAERRGAEAFQRAEHFYRLGAIEPTPGENPNRKALKELYRRTRGTLDGWEAYEAEFDEADRERRRSAVLADRQSDPETLPPFRLQGMDGVDRTSGELGGRVVVINFWGVWCTWCVKEMPEFQQLHERYEETEDVVILSINNDDDWNVAREWMAEHQFDFAVLRDDGYVAGDAGVTGFPTTWFVDRVGRIAFEKRGWTENLVEEFSWRIEALRTPPAE